MKEDSTLQCASLGVFFLFLYLLLSENGVKHETCMDHSIKLYFVCKVPLIALSRIIAIMLFIVIVLLQLALIE